MEETSAENTPGLDPGAAYKPSRGKSSTRSQTPNPNEGPTSKRRCVSTACIACRRRKSKCDGNLPSCAACSSVYHTTCVYDPNSDHRRKGVYKKDTDALRIKNTTLVTLIQALLNYEEEDAFELVRQIRACDNLEDVAHSIIGEQKDSIATNGDAVSGGDDAPSPADQFESELAGKMSELMLDGSRKLIGGTSNLIFLPPGSELYEFNPSVDDSELDQAQDRSVTKWTRVTSDEQLISHLLTMYFTWHYPFFTTLSKDLFYRDYVRGVSSQYCSSLLVNAMLALGCHFSTWNGVREDPENSATAGDHFFKEAKRLVLENDEHVNAKLCTVQALALMSVREAGCGREGKGWVYSGMSFRMALDLGLNFDSATFGARNLDEEELDARRVTFWGCFLIDKCWSNYLGRQPQLPTSSVSIPKMEILPNEEAGLWSSYTDTGAIRETAQPSRTRTVALQISKLCELSGNVLIFFYDPTPRERPLSKQAELKKLSDIHTKLVAWKRDLPTELEPKEGQLPQALLMHMFYQLLFIHLYRPFLKYTRATSPLPAHASPRKLCTQAASAISKLLRVYKRTYGFKQICNIAVYIAHTACTIHLLNMPEKTAQRDFVHGLRHLEEMGESWLCARRTLRILEISANKWQVTPPNEAAIIFEQTHEKWGSWGSWDQASSPSNSDIPSPVAPPPAATAQPLTSPEERIASMNEHGGLSVSAPQSSMGTATSRYPAGVSMADTVSAMRTAHRAASAQIARTDVPLPEPTYLRPLPHAYGPLQPVPLSQHDAWYSSNEPQVGAMGSGQGIPPTADSSPTSFDTPENLVEESQDWWSRDPNALHLAMGSWNQSWNPGLTGPSSDPRFENYVPNPRQPSDPGSHTSRPPPQAHHPHQALQVPPAHQAQPVQSVPPVQPVQPVSYPIGMSPGMVRPDQGPGYSNIGFPNNFQQ